MNAQGRSLGRIDKRLNVLKTEMLRGILMS